jgi:predicted regulator of Ras-like GTPase activity (Roadblock/LC7/MglB family)
VATRPPAQDGGSIATYLESFRRMVGAKDVLLVDIVGHVVERAGPAGDFTPDVVGILLANGMAAANEMASGLEQGGMSIFFHEGSKFDLYAATVGADNILAMIFDRGRGNPRIGTVYLHLKRAAEDLIRLFQGETALAQRGVLEAPGAVTQPGARPAYDPQATVVARRPWPEPASKPSRVLSYEEAARLGLIRAKEEPDKELPPPGVGGGQGGRDG